MFEITTVKEIIHQIRKTSLEKKKFKDSIYKYYNFWEISDPSKVWFSKFIEFHQINPLKKELNFISVFGYEYSHFLISSPKIFFSGEDLNSNTFPKLRRYKKILKKMDLFLGFEEEDDVKSFYLPLWFLSFIEPNSTIESITTTINKINNVNHRKGFRTKFASQISRHDINGVREKIILLLQTIDNVDCAGKFMKNTDDLKSKFGDRKIDFLQNYKFNICPENTDTRGYITEKIIDSFLAGCIPIYWSEKNFADFKIFNKNSILFYDENDPQKLYNKISKLYRNENAFNEFISRPIFTDKAPELIITHLDKLKQRLKEVIDAN